MKTIKTLFFTTLLFTISASSQITKGNWMVGGSGSFSSTESYTKANKSQKGKEIEYELNTGLGYFIIDKLAFGTKIGYNNYSIPNAPVKNTGNSSFQVGAFTRYYILKPEKTYNIFTEIGYNYGENKINNNEFKINYNQFVFAAGPVINFNNSVALELGLNYSTTSFKLDDSVKNRILIALGFQIFLEKK